MAYGSIPPATSASNSKVAGAKPPVPLETVSTVSGSVRAATSSNESNTCLAGAGNDVRAKLPEGVVVSAVAAEELPPS
jgi:hypothetical protein